MGEGATLTQHSPSVLCLCSPTSSSCLCFDTSLGDPWGADQGIKTGKRLVHDCAADPPGTVSQGEPSFWKKEDRAQHSGAQVPGLGTRGVRGEGLWRGLSHGSRPHRTLHGIPGLSHKRVGALTIQRPLPCPGEPLEKGLQGVVQRCLLRDRQGGSGAGPRTLCQSSGLVGVGALGSHSSRPWEYLGHATYPFWTFHFPSRTRRG